MGTVPTPGTAVAGVAALASQGNSWRDSNTWCLSNHPMGVFRSSTTPAVTTLVSSPVLLDVEDIDSDGGHSLVTNTSRYTAQTAGWYIITAYISFASDADVKIRQLEIRVNSAGIVLSSTNGVGTVAATHLSTSTHYFLNGTTDFVEMYAFHNKGSNLNLGAQCRLTVEWRRNL